MALDFDDFFRKILFARQLKVSDGYLSIYNEPYVMFPADSFSILMDSTLELSGKKGKIKIYKEGIKTGESIASKLEKSTNTSGDKLLDVIFHIGGLGGWGQWQIYKKDVAKKEIVVHGYNMATARSSFMRKKKSEPTCHLLRGIIAGELRVSWGSKDIEVIETQCMSQGYRYCEFIARLKNNLDRKNKFVKNQLEL